MKTATLMLSTTLASMMLLAPISFSQADAAGIKIKPQIVKVRPKIAVAKPKVRVNVRAAKVRIKPKIKTKTVRIKPKIKVKAARIKPRIKVRKLQPKLIARTTVTPKFKITPRVKPQLQPRVVGKLTVNQPRATSGRPDWWRPNRWKPQGTVKLILPDNPSARHPVQRVATPTMNTGNTSAVRSSKKMSNTAVGTIQASSMKQAGRSFDQLANHNGIKDAMNAARAAEAAGEVITLGKHRVAATPDMGLPTRDLGSTVPSNQDILNGMTKKPGKTGTSTMNPDSLWGQNDIGGFGPDSFAGSPGTGSQGPANSKGTTASDAAKGFWGVTEDTIAGAIGGVANDKTGGGSVTTSPRETTVHDDGSISSGYTKYRSDGNRIHVSEELAPLPERRVTVVANDGEVISQEHARIIVVQGNPHSMVTRQTNLNRSGSGDGRAPDVNRLIDPDSGYSGPSPFPWIDETNKADLSTAGNGKTPGGLPDAPDQSQPTGWSSGSAMYSANDVLERYDEDGRNRGETTPIDRSRIQSD